MLEVNSLSVAYNGSLILDDVTLTVHPGEIMVVIGPNGAGKTTLVRAISGVIPARRGKISIGEKELSQLPVIERARYIAVVPQARNLPAAFTVYQAVMLGRTPYLGWLGNAGSADIASAHLALERTQTVGLTDRRVSELSGGEQQRVLLARALAQETPVLLLDEPTTHLDLHHQSDFLNLVRELTTNNKLAVLMVLHDLNLAGYYADRVALLVDGELKAIGEPDEVLTENKLAAAYKIPVNVVSHPIYGSPLILPDGRNQ